MTIIAVIGSILSIVLLVLERYYSIKAEKRKLAEQAKKDLDAANKNDDKSAFLDAFSRLR